MNGGSTTATSRPSGGPSSQQSTSPLTTPTSESRRRLYARSTGRRLGEISRRKLARRKEGGSESGCSCWRATVSDCDLLLRERARALARAAGDTPTQRKEAQKKQQQQQAANKTETKEQTFISWRPLETEGERKREPANGIPAACAEAGERVGRERKRGLPSAQQM